MHQNPTPGGPHDRQWSPEKALDKIRKLLAKAEADGVTEAEAELLNDKAAELIAQYGIDRARLAAEKPETDQIIRKQVRSRPPSPATSASCCGPSPARCASRPSASSTKAGGTTGGTEPTSSWT